MGPAERVIVTLETHGPDTRVVVTHQRITDAKLREQHEQGWLAASRVWRDTWRAAARRVHAPPLTAWLPAPFAAILSAELACAGLRRAGVGEGR